MLNLPPILNTERLLLRKPVLGDATSIFAAYGQDPAVAHFMVWRPHTSIEQTNDFIRECIKCWENEARRPYVITLRGAQTPIGMVDARFDAHMVDIGYVLEKSHWGRGLMPEAVKSLAQALFQLRGIHRLQATCDVENTPSRRTLEKASFECEGKLAQYTIHPNIQAAPRDCYMYALCRAAA